MSTPKPTTSRKKTQIPSSEKDEKKQPDTKPATDGLTGQGAESVIPHLRDYEQSRKTRSGGKE